MVGFHDRPSESQVPASPTTPEIEALLGDAMGSAQTLPEEGRSDILSDVLRTVKLSGALFFAVDAAHPWGVDVPHADRIAPAVLPGAQHVVSYDIVLSGSGWVSMAGMTPVRFESGDILIFPQAGPYALLSAPDQQPEFDVDATTHFLSDMARGKLPFVVREGGSGPERTQFVCGYLGCDLRPFNPLLATLPEFICVKRAGPDRDDLLDRLIRLTLTEARSRRFGGQAIGLRLSELIFVEALRRYLESLPEDQRGWLAGLRDPSVAHVLGLFHEEPARDWTLDELARSAGLSRAVLADRFAQMVGCAPMRYLTLWRMQIAARLIADRGLNIAAVAHEVGYGSEAAFSRAFKRTTGVSPASWRAGMRGGG
jgi:AraC-like DNA-binding protein